MVTTLLLAHPGAVLMAPAMNDHMWAHPATQANRKILAERGVAFVGPGSGFLACRTEATGRMSEPEDIFAAIKEMVEAMEQVEVPESPEASVLEPGSWSGKKVVITAGPTHEPLDPVRYLANRSSGAMGLALAAAAVQAGAQVHLICGPTDLLPPRGLAEVIQVQTAREMADAVATTLTDGPDWLMMAAAVADYGMAEVGAAKLKKEDLGEEWKLTLVRNPDILGEVVPRHRNAELKVLGFALETDALLERAQAKRQAKNMDYIVANDPTQEGSGFGPGSHQVTLLGSEGRSGPVNPCPRPNWLCSSCSNWRQPKTDRNQNGTRQGKANEPGQHRQGGGRFLALAGTERPQPRVLPFSEPGPAVTMELPASVEPAPPPASPDASDAAVPASPPPASAAPASDDPFQAECDRFVQQTLQAMEREGLLSARTGPGSAGDPATDLAALKEVVAPCTACALHQGRTRTVFGSGDAKADILFIGEAPGRDEDLQGEPFVGKSGQLLTKIIGAIGFARDQVYICNILKCRPPNNRDPLPEEVACCEPYLKQQLEIIRPRVICCLGRIAAQTLLKTEASLRMLRETAHFYEGIPVMATYHPAPCCAIPPGSGTPGTTCASCALCTTLCWPPPAGREPDMSLPTVLIIDDEPDFCSDLSLVLSRDFLVSASHDGKEALELVDELSPDLVLLDVEFRPGQMPGLEILEHLQAKEDPPPVIMLSGSRDINVVVQAVKLGAFHYVNKGADLPDLVNLMGMAMSSRRDRLTIMAQRAEVQRLTGNLIARDPATIKILDKVDQVAATDVNVLITGESGTGKEMIARRLHNESGVSGTLVGINCATFEGDLINSEIFGHVKGRLHRCRPRSHGQDRTGHRGHPFPG
jgi:phosphopantothenoylcysteine decarboxylase/phosphopantothenate--cysteine ligase